MYSRYLDSCPDVEYCDICHEYTDRAGRADDSIYRILNFPLYDMKKGDEIGPLCEDCNDALDQLGVAAVD